jgi:ATP-dependent Clp protease ATP-binding subunit ClpA
MSKQSGADVWKLVLSSAMAEARRRGDRRIGTDHLLLGLLHDEDPRVAETLGVSLAEARAVTDALDVAALAAVGIEVETLRDDGRPAPFGRRLPPLTSGARAVLKGSIDAARPGHRRRISTTHFLFALLSLQRPDPAAELLDALGVDRAAVFARLTGPAGGEAA